jgi:anti-anti-sigma factor
MKMPLREDCEMVAVPSYSQRRNRDLGHRWRSNSMAPPVQNATSMHIEQSARDGCIVVTLIGDLDVAAAPRVQRALLRCLAEQPDAVICDLSKVTTIDPVCAGVFAAVAHRPRTRWPDSSILLCSARPAVAAVLRRRGMPRILPIYDTLDQAVAHARSHPPFLQERLRLVPTLDAITTAGWFVGEVCQNWQLDELTETARSLAGEMVADAVLDERNDIELIELRAQLRAIGLLIAVQSGGASLALTRADQQGEPGSGLEMVQRVAQRWGVRRQADGSRVVWCILGRAS